MSARNPDKHALSELARKGADHALERTLFRQLFDSSPEGIVLLDVEDCIVLANKSFLEMFGYREEEVLQQPINTLIVEGDLNQEASELTQRVLNQESIEQETVRYRKDGGMIYVSILGVPIQMPEGQVGVYGIYRDITRQKLAEELLRQSEDKYRTMIEAIDDGYFELDLDGQLLFANEALARMLEQPLDTLKSRNFRDLFSDDSVERFAELARNVRKTGESIPSFAWDYRPENGPVRHLETSIALVISGGGKPAGYRGIVRDVSERIRAEAALRESEARYRIMAEHTGQLVYDCDLDTGRVSWSGAIERVTGETPEEIARVDVDQWVGRMHEDDREKVLAERKKARQQCGRYHVEYRLALENGEQIHAEENGTFLRDESGRVHRMIGTISDVSERHRMTEEMAYQATHDELTDLYNRRKFEEVLSELLSQQSGAGTSHALLYMDLDQFKVVNDTCGHHAGDELLKQLAGLLRGHLRSADTLARLGGDEFGLILFDCGLEDAEHVAGKILSVINRFSFEWGETTFRIGVSIGIVDLTGHDDLSEVLMAADQACYSAKNKGRNRVQVFHFEDAELTQHQTEVSAAAGIADALKEDRFELHYQRIVTLSEDDGPGHYELLLRLRDREGELVLPAHFIPGAERFNMMYLIDRWVVQRAIEGIRRCMDAGDYRTGERFSINLAGSSFGEASFPDLFEQELARHGVPPEALALEVTESSAILNFERALSFIRTVRAMGMKVMLDDFGSGLSSFAYLKALPVDYLKVDGNLVKDVANGPIDYAMVEAIYRVGQAIGVPTVAEHVSSPEILERLREIGIQYGQGFHFHEPEPWVWGRDGSD